MLDYVFIDKDLRAHTVRLSTDASARRIAQGKHYIAAWRTLGDAGDMIRVF
tara:strand:- start:232 stop:384 length:153 start_codon:yes stop_codon:yes gene_type:complete